MLLSLVLLAGGVYLGLREDAKAKQRLRASMRSDRRKDPDEDVIEVEEPSLFASAEEKTQALIVKAMQLTGSDSRLQQEVALAKHAQEAPAPITAKDRYQNRQLLASAAALGLSTAGLLLFPPLSLLAAPLLAYLSVPVYQQAARDWKDEQRIKISGLMAVFTTGSWLIHARLVSALGMLSLKVAEKINTLSQDRTHKKLRALFERHQSKVFIYRDGVEVEVLLDEVRTGDELLVRAGQIIPVDGRVMEGMATVDQHQMTGESRLIDKGVGDHVLSATMVQRGELRVQVERAGRDTLAAQISDILEQTTTSKLDRPDRGLRLANAAVVPSLLISGAALPFYGVRSSMALLYAMPGVDMYYAGPIALLTFLEMAAERQILIKDGRSLELLRGIDTVIFDKTGTLTLEQPELAEIHCWGELSSDELLRLAAAAEHRQTHPAANAILAEAKRRGLSCEDVTESRYEVGFGIEVRIGRRLVRIGSERFMMTEGLALPSRAMAVRSEANQKGHSLIYLAVGKKVVGGLELRPILRDDVQEVVADLRRRKIEIIVLSGDQKEPTEQLATSLGIERYYAGVLPEEKAEIVERLQKEGRKVCFIGDGVNDAIALKKADVSISIHGATLIATDTAQIVFMDQSLRGLPGLLDMARALEHNVYRSFGISLGIATALLASVFVLNGNIGFLLSTGPLSLVVVVLNALSSKLTYKDQQLPATANSSNLPN